MSDAKAPIHEKKEDSDQMHSGPAERATEALREDAFKRANDLGNAKDSHGPTQCQQTDAERKLPHIRIEER